MNFFDTANVYYLGTSGDIFGWVLMKEHANRDEVVIAKGPQQNERWRRSLIGISIARIIEPKKEIKESRKLFSNADLKNLIVPLFWEQLLVVLAFNRSLLGFLFSRVESDVMEGCVTYLSISAYSYPAIAVYSAGAALFRSMGRTKVTMVISFASNGINVVGNAIGIFVLYAGVAGVAYPFLIARVFSAAVILVMCFGKSNTVTIHKETMGRILRIAVPKGVENGLLQLAKVTLSSITAVFGTVQIAANGVAQSFWSLAALIGVFMGPVFITVIGQCMGAGDPVAADYYIKKRLRITFAVSIAWDALMFIAVFPAMKLFALSEETVRLVIILVLIHNVFNALFFPLAGPFPNGLRAAGDVRFPLLSGLFTTVIYRVLLSVMFAVWLNLGVIGIAWAMCADWGIKTVMMIVHYRGGKWMRYKVI